MSDDNLKSCNESVAKLKELIERNNLISLQNDRREKEWLKLKEQWRNEYTVALKGIESELSGYGVQQEYGDSDCRNATWGKDADDSSCRSKYNNQGFTSGGELKGCKYKTGLDSAPIWIDGWRRACFKSQMMLDQEKAELQRRKDELNASIRGQRGLNPDPLRPQELQRIPFLPLTNIICQDCSNKVNFEDVTDTKAIITQVNKCIADLSGGNHDKEEEQAPVSRMDTTAIILIIMVSISVLILILMMIF